MVKSIRLTTKQKKKLILATSVMVSLPTDRSIASWSLAAGKDMRDSLASRAWVEGSCLTSMMLLKRTRCFLDVAVVVVTGHRSQRNFRHLTSLTTRPPLTRFISISWYQNQRLSVWTISANQQKVHNGQCYNLLYISISFSVAQRCPLLFICFLQTQIITGNI